MEITQELVERIARLAQLTLSDEEKNRMRTQLEEILGSMTALDRLQLVDEPAEQDGECVLRPDEVGQSLDRADLLISSPVSDGEYILAPGGNGQGGTE